MTSIRALSCLAVFLLLAACDDRTNGLGPGLSTGDRTRPRVVSTAPIDQSTQVVITNPITVTFSEAVHAPSITTASIAFSPAIAGTVSLSGATATFTPSAALATATVYTGTVSTAVEDLAGNNLAAPFTWTFTTGGSPPVVP